MTDFLINNASILWSTLGDLFLGSSPMADCNIVGPKTMDILKNMFLILKILVPILVLVLCTMDIAKAVIAQDDGDIKKAQSSALKRIAIGIVIFLIPDVIDILLKAAGIATGTCGIG